MALRGKTIRSWRQNGRLRKHEAAIKRLKALMPGRGGRRYELSLPERVIL
jgi:hypothetical protein